MLKRYAIRRAKSADIDRILEIELASFGREAYDRKLFAEYHRKCGELFLLAQGARTADGGRIIDGYSIACMCERRGNRVASLESIAVAPNARGKGAASSLLKSTIRRLKLRGVGRLTLMVRSSNGDAMRLYERCGFAAVRRAPGYYEDGEDGLLMRKDLML